MRKLALLAFISLFLVSCGGNKLKYTPDETVCVGRNTLLTLPVCQVK